MVALKWCNSNDNFLTMDNQQIPQDQGQAAPASGTVLSSNDGQNQPANQNANQTNPVQGQVQGQNQAQVDGNKPQDQVKPPENVEVYDFKAPEGMVLDQELLGEFTGIVKEAGLKSDVAKKIFEVGPKLMSKWQAAQAENFLKTRESWVNEIKNDKDFGGDKFQSTVDMAIKGVSFAEKHSPGLRKLLQETGWGDNPVLVKAFRAIGQALGEDTMVGGSTGNGGEKTLAQRLYPNMNP